jgi:two-component sensor histidine kinase
MNLYDWLFNPSGLTPHGFCLLWKPGLIYLHVVSDAIIGIAYYSIPLALAAFASKRKDLEYTWVVKLFVAFILACGTTHLFSILTLWVPAYGLEGVVKGITAALSIATAFLLWPLIPKLVAIPSPRQLGEANTALGRKIAEHEATLSLLRQRESEIIEANEKLEERVSARTEELKNANDELMTALGQRDLLLREVYHRVKNNLQVIDSIVALQSRKIQDASARDALSSLRSRIHALGSVHQQLMTSSDLRSIDIRPFLTELTDNLLAASGRDNVKISCASATKIVSVDFAISIGLIITELVTNSLKHAFSDKGGQVEVVINKEDNGNLKLIVSDDGTHNTKLPQKSAGLGTTLLRGFASQLKAVVNVSIANGTRTEVEIPAGAVA